MNVSSAIGRVWSALGKPPTRLLLSISVVCVVLVPLCCGALVVLARSGEDGAAKPAEYSWQRTESSLALTRKGRILWRYNFGKNEPKPHFHPLCLPDGTELTWLRPEDHPWHLAGWFSWKYINGVLYWETDTKTGLSPGRTQVTDVKVTTAENFQAKFALNISYHPHGREPVLTEQRTVVVGAPTETGHYAIDWRATFKAGAADVVLDRTPLPHETGGKPWGGYAGLSLRLAKHTRGWHFLDSEGRGDGKKIHGRSARWVDYSGRTTAGSDGGIAVLDHPDNPRHPSRWFVDQQMPYFSPAVLFDKAHRIRAGQSITLHYKIVVHPGAVHRENMEALWRAFAKAPSARQEAGW